MKNIRFFASLIVALFCVTALRGKESIQIGEDVFYLAHEENVKEGSLKEFIPVGETLGTWSTLVAVRHFMKVRSPKKYIQNMAQQYRAKMPNVQFAIFEKKESKEWMIDFLIFPDGQNAGFFEWNYFQASKVRGVSGITVNQFVTRKPLAIGELVEEAFAEWDIGSFRKKMLPILMKSKFEIIGWK